MKNNTTVRFRKAVPIAAVLVLCICVSVGAAGRFGQFRDIVNWIGAVTGTEYVQAPDEILLHAAAEQKELVITAEFLRPDAAPYRHLDSLGLGGYQILDATGKVIAEGTGSDFVEIPEDRAVMRIPLTDMPAGDYTLRVDAWIGCAKADQPIRISGGWTCDFSV